MATIWKGDDAVAAEKLISQVMNDIDWLAELRQDVQRELTDKRALLEWSRWVRYFIHK